MRSRLGLSILSNAAHPVTPRRSSTGARLRRLLPRRDRRIMTTLPAAGLGAILCASVVIGCGGAGAGNSPVLLAAGDIAECDHQGDEATARILAEYPRAMIAALGDLAYQHGSREDFERCFGPSWGTFRDRIRPATGNHDHSTTKARGYAGYFGARAAAGSQFRYGYDVGAWHVVVLDSDCWRVGGCGIDDPQARWMRAELRRNARRCTLAYWHRPPFSSGRYGDAKDTAYTRPLWQVAVAEGVDVVLTGHEHSYERFAPMDAAGRPDHEGTQLFVVGTGGGNLRRYHRPRLPTTAVRNDDTWGVLRLTLRPDGYDWRFLPVAGRTFSDAGSRSCN